MERQKWIYILLSIKTRIETAGKLGFQELKNTFISYYPLKQGLKHVLLTANILHIRIYILLSIKTRIETKKAKSAI